MTISFVIRRVFRILIGYLLAVASATFWVVLPLSLLAVLRGTQPEEALAGIFLGITFGSLFVGSLSFAPALCFITFAEVFRLRSRLLYISMGALTSVCAVVWLSLTAEPTDARMLPSDFAIFIYGGVIAGLTYWYITGRTAGTWTNNRSASPTQPSLPPEQA